MDENKYFSGGVFFFLLTNATLPNKTAREHEGGECDDHAEPIVMQDLILAIDGHELPCDSTGTSEYKRCKSEGNVNVPFNDVAVCTSYHYLVLKNYRTALKRMDSFVKGHLNPGKREWLVKAVLDLIENDKAILDSDHFYIMTNGQPVTKAEIKNQSEFDLSSFLVGITEYILFRLRNKNNLGETTLKAISIKKNRKPPIYDGHLGEHIDRDINVSYLPERESIKSDSCEVLVESNTNEDTELILDTPKNNETEVYSEQSDDEVIREEMNRIGEKVLPVFSAINTATDSMRNNESASETVPEYIEALKTVKAACTLDESVEENMEQAISTVGTVLQGRKHAMAEEIRRRQNQDPIYDNESSGEDKGSSNTETTVIEQQISVVQNGTHNVNINKNEGNVTFNL